MKKLILIFFLVLGWISANCQTKPDTTYVLHEKDLRLLYDLLNSGQNAVNNSDAYSKNDGKKFAWGVAKLDSVFRPQINKWHPPKKK